jgi:metallophosphoesterase superfamily enzyme
MKSKTKIIFVLPAFLFLAASTALADNPVKQYYYSDFISTIKVNTDSTLDVQEQEQFVFEGEYHTAFRNIPLGKVDAITNIQVIDLAPISP